MHARDLRGLQDRVGGRLGIEAADIFCNSAVEQRHILGQITDMASKVFVAPLIDGGAIKPYRTLFSGPDSDQRL